MKTIRSKEEREQQYQQLANLMLENKDYRSDCWKCIREFYRRYHHVSIDEAIDKPITSISTVERDWRKLRENNPKLKEKELDQAEYKQTALDSVVIKEDGAVRIL